MTAVSSRVDDRHVANELTGSPPDISARRTLAEMDVRQSGSVPALPTPAPKDSHRYHAVFFANLSLISLTIGAAALGLFFLVSAYTAGGPSYERAINLGVQALTLDAAKHETAVLKTIELQGDKYVITYTVTPGGGSATAVTDASGTRLVSARRP